MTHESRTVGELKGYRTLDCSLVCDYRLLKDCFYFSTVATMSTEWPFQLVNVYLQIEYF